MLSASLSLTVQPLQAQTIINSFFQLQPGPSVTQGGQRGVGQWPSIFQCTWRTSNNADTVFFLGASLAGQDCNSVQQVGKWKGVLRNARFELLWSWLPLKQDKHGEGASAKNWALDYSPSIEVRGTSGTRFGNCGETYPFLNVFL